jgi:hypothetical protein
VNDPRLVGGGQTVRDLNGEIEQLADGERAGQEQFMQRAAVDQFDGYVGNRSGRSHIVDSDDVGVRESRGGARLPFEALQPLRVGGELRGENLDGDVAAEARVARPMDLSHPSGADRRKDLVWAETLSCRESHGFEGILRPQACD